MRSKILYTRALTALLAFAVTFGIARPSLAAKERVRAESRNASPQGNNANGWYGELKGNEHKFHGWSGNKWTPAAQNQRLTAGTLGALLFSNAAVAPDPVPDNQPPTGLFTQNFKGNQTVNANEWMLFDRVVDKNAVTCVAAGPGCIDATAFLRNGADVPSSLHDPLRRHLRQPAFARSLWEVTITNDGKSAVTLENLWINVDNTGNVFDLTIPFSPDGPLASPTPSFVPGQVILPGGSLTYSFLAGNDMLAISAETAVFVDGQYIRGLTAVPEPGTLAVLLTGLVGLIRVRRSTSER